MDTMEGAMAETTANLTELEKKVRDLHLGGSTTPRSDSEWSERGSVWSKLADLEAEIGKWKAGWGKECSAVLGGLKGYDGDGWKDWVTSLLAQQGLHPQEVYWKGDWNGMLWAKFNNESERDKAVKVLKGCGLGAGGWAGVDRVLEDRVVGSFLLGLKRHLVDWGFDRKEVRVDLDKDPATTTVGKGKDGKPVITARVRGGKMEVDWVDATWGEWEELTSSSEYRALISKAAEKLGKSSGGGSAGKGKGKAKGKTA